MLRFLTAVAGDRWHRRRAASTIRSNADRTDAEPPETL